MIRFFSRWITLLVLGATLSGGLFGCGGKPINESDPNSLFQDAEEDIKNDHYVVALDKLRTVKNKFPYSKIAVDAQLRIADVYFLQESWPEAASAYETFRDLHPKHERVGYAMFRAAKSYFNDIPSTIARDLTPAQKAVDAYNDFLRRFPSAPETAEARKDLAQAREDLAEKELYVGNFYFRQDFFDSAKPRYQKVIELYPDTPAAEKARGQLSKIDDELAKARKP